jgi:hypothetical protein
MLIGHIIRLQIQRQPLKRAVGAERLYELTHLAQVDALTLSPQGASAHLDGDVVLDVHHMQHPLTRFRAEDQNALSFNVSGHYAQMRDKFGPHITPGCAAENILIEFAPGIDSAQLRNGIAITTRSAAVLKLQAIQSAPPCAPFSRWALAHASGNNVSPQLQKDALQFLDHGMRGFYCEYKNEMHIIEVGDSVALL